MKNNQCCIVRRRRYVRPFIRCLLLLPAVFFTTMPAWSADENRQCNISVGGLVKRVVHVDMVAINQPFWYNRMGAAQLDGMIYALASDVLYKGKPLDQYAKWEKSGSDLTNFIQSMKGGGSFKVSLRPDKRPRPIVLRANVNDCLQIRFTNLLHDFNGPPSATSYAGVHIQGTEVFSTVLQNTAAIKNDGAFIGKNSNNLAASGERKHYSLFIPEEGAFVINSSADDFSNNSAGQITAGLFGALNVQPEGAEYYRSQVTHRVLSFAKTGETVNGQPIINYNATFKAASGSSGNATAKNTFLSTHPWFEKGLPVLNMLIKQSSAGHFKLVYTDTTAIISGPNAGAFPPDDKDPEFFQVPVTPERNQPWREFNIMYHEPINSVQAFSEFSSGNLANTLGTGGDFFGINYGTAAIGPEIWANRLNIGPMHDCVTCEYEEFFLSSWAVGDPAMVVDVPANFSSTTPIDSGLDVPPGIPPSGDPVSGPKATKAFFPDDPSNVYHSYLSDHVKMRIHHGGGTLHHLHHLHAHQWLHSPNSDDGHYLDSQLIGPGSSFTLEMVHNGSGNRNQTVGDSIFHCHFYPHFAEGMWSLWRVHDVFEAGTQLNVTTGKPAKGSRALPDGEIVDGTPIPAIVPLPTRAMPPMPSDVYIVDGKVHFGEYPTTGSAAEKEEQIASDLSGMAVTQNPGFPFFIPGIAGERAPHPPLDFAKLGSQTLNGGLPRHVIERPGGYVATNSEVLNAPKVYAPNIHYNPDIVEYHNRFDFSKFYSSLTGYLLPEEGTPVEKIAMDAHSVRYHRSFTPEGQPANFIYNGLPPVSGAPYADPCVSDFGDHVPTAAHPRHYRGVDMQMDVVLNKKGWHYSQQRFGVLWEDLIPTITKERPPEPLFFRANSGDCIEYWLANIVPEYYELDDFQVRTPTDVLGQHIHLVKFDVTSSDGGANGWNYEDGTFSPQAVVERIDRLNAGGGLAGYTEKLVAEKPTWLCDGLTGGTLAKCLHETDTNPEWLGAQATVQRWYADPQVNNLGKDRTLRTVFTHDHFSPSTHQQAGLYMGLLVEPEGSKWKDSETGVAFYTRKDGGPTSWAAVIETPDRLSESYREFVLEFQDFQLAYAPTPDGTVDFTEYPEANESLYYPNAEADKTCLSEPAASRPACYKTFYKTTTEPAINAISAPAPQPAMSAPTPLPSPVAVLPAEQYVSSIRAQANGYSGYINPDYVINPPSTGSNTVQTPTLISSTPPFALGTYSVNYRNEPLPFRVWDPQSNVQPGTEQGDLASVYRSIERADPALNTVFSPAADSLNAGVYPFDPATPLLRAYQGDNVQVRTLVGAHINMHNFSMQGVRWLFEPSNDRSGYRSNQPMGISEHFEMLFQMPPATVNKVSARVGGGKPTNRCGKPKRLPSRMAFADYLYNPSSEQNGLLNGNWGLLRSYAQGQGDICLEPLPAEATVVSEAVASSDNIACPASAPTRSYNVHALQASVIYNSRGSNAGIDPNAMIYIGCDSTVNSHCTPVAPSSGDDVAPFVLRAAAGECITVNLTNKLVANTQALAVKESITSRNPLLQFRYTTTTPPNQYQLSNGQCSAVVRQPGVAQAYLCDMTLTPSSQVALAPQLVSYDVNQSNGQNLGFNDTQTAVIGATQRYTWYAGIVTAHSDAGAVCPDPSNTINGVKYCYQPAEFGSANLLTADSVQQIRFGMLAGMVIEPEGACWASPNGTLNPGCGFSVPSSVLSNNAIAGEDSSSTTGPVAVVYVPKAGAPNEYGNEYFREFVAMAQDSLMFDNNLYGFNYAGDPQGQNGIGVIDRYFSFAKVGQQKFKPAFYDVACAYSNALGDPAQGANPNTGSSGTYVPLGDPQAAIFQANPGDPLRLRVMQPSGADQHVFELFGHVWQEEPYNEGSTVIADNPTSQWQGSRMGLSAADRFDIVISSAGGTFQTPGDYLFRSYPGGDQMNGMWGLLRVGTPSDPYTADQYPAFCNPENYLPSVPTPTPTSAPPTGA